MKAFLLIGALACQNKKLWFCVVTFFFFFKDFCTHSLTLGSNAGEWGRVVPFKILQSLKQNDLPSDVGDFHKVML